MKVFVTGANGFIGTALTKALIARGDEVFALILKGSPKGELPSLDVEIIEGDILQCEERCKEALLESEIIYHLAGARIGLNEKHFFKINVEGTRHLLDICREHSSLKRFVYISSATVSGPSPRGEERTEEDAFPLTPYARSKYAAEQLFKEEPFAQIPHTIIRPTAIYGPRTTEFVSLLDMVVKWHVRPIMGVFTHCDINFCHVDDLIKGILLAAHHPDAIGETFIIGGSTLNWVSVGKVAAKAYDIKTIPLRIPIPILFVAAAAAHLLSLIIRHPFELNWWRAVDFSQSGWTFSSKKAEKILGYRPQKEPEEGFRETIDWFVQNGWIKPFFRRKQLPPPAQE